MKHTNYWYWLSFALLAVSGQAQSYFQNPVILTEEDGLPENYVSSIAQDSAGFTWIGSTRGLCRYDGSQVKLYQNIEGDSSTLNNDYINKVYVDQEGQLWACTSTGLSRYLPATDNFEVFYDPSIKGHRINDILQDRQGQYWLSLADKPLASFDTKEKKISFIPFTPPREEHPDQSIKVNDTRVVIQDRTNDSLLWVGTHAGILKYNKYSRDFQRHYLHHENKEWEYLLNSIKLLYHHDDGLLYIGSWSGAYVFNPKTEQFRIIGPFAAPPSPGSVLHKRSVTSIMPFPNHQLGITFSTGFVFYDPYQKKVTSFQLLDEENIQLLRGGDFQDANGRIWCSSPFGLYIFNPQLNQFVDWQIPHEKEDWIYHTRAVVESNDGRYLYVSGYSLEGIYIFDRWLKKWELIPGPQDHSKQDGSFSGQDMIRLRDGRILLITSGDLFYFDEHRKTITPIKLNYDFNAPSFRRVIEGPNGEIWIGSRRVGLFRVDLKKKTVRQFQILLEVGNTLGRSTWLEYISTDREGRIWIRTARHYSVYEPNTNQFIHCAPAPGDSGTYMANISGFAMDQEGNIWMAGVESGLGLVNMEHPDRGFIRRYTQADGMAEKYVLNVGADQKGALWLGHEKGISCFDPQTATFRYYDQGYGYPPPNQHIMQSLSSGEMIMGTQKGFCIFHPDSLRLNQELPRPYLTSFKVFDKELIHVNQLVSPNTVKLSYKENFFSFEFSAIAYNLPSRVTFAYKLEGIDEDWVQAGKRNYASYTNISGGDYVFKLRAANSEGVWNETPYEFNISITTPWWKTLWFWSLFIGILLWIIIWGMRWRIRQIRSQANLRTEFNRKLTAVEMNALRSQMNPHFIFNSLNSIDYYILKNDTEKASDYLNRFSRLIRLILQNSRAKYVNLKDELEALKLYIELESLRFEGKFDYVVKIEKGLPIEEIELPPMILQPFVENAIWHGLVQKQDKGRLDLAITRENGHLHCVIEDDGIGRDAAQQLKSKTATRHKSMGMRITGDRLQMINETYGSKAKVIIIDQKDENGKSLGTRVELDIPIGGGTWE